MQNRARMIQNAFVNVFEHFLVTVKKALSVCLLIVYHI